MNDSTALAGQALANAVRTANTTGLHSQATNVAAQVADILTTTALANGATADDIRRAAGLPT